eukprot:SAG11_NODE_6505_length_1300_cov_2.165695_2_plen_79_part_00
MSYAKVRTYAEDAVLEGVVDAIKSMVDLPSNDVVRKHVCNNNILNKMQELGTTFKAIQPSSSKDAKKPADVVAADPGW